MHFDFFDVAKSTNNAVLENLVAQLSISLC